MATKLYISNGNKFVPLKADRKSINPLDLDSDVGWSNVGMKPDDAKLVPVVYAAWQMRCKAMADLPFVIYKGDTVIDDSDEWQNKVGFLSDPRRFLWLTEAALVGSGQAYWFNERNRVKTLSLKYFKASSISTNLDPNKGVTGFTRDWGRGQKEYDVEDVFYVWLPDPDVELGPPLVSPLSSAVSVAGAIGDLNHFVSDFMERGAVKAFLLGVTGNPPPEEKEKLEKTWNKTGGVKGLFWRVFNKEKVDPVIIGEGLEGLRGATIVETLQKQVLQAMGVPPSKVLANAANYATALQDDKGFYQNTILPDARLIGDALNVQILEKMGYHIEFKPQRLECFQENQNETAQTLSAYANLFQNSLEGALIAMAQVGISLTDEAQALIDARLKQKEENKIQMAEQMKPKEEPPAEEQEEAETQEQEAQKAVKIELDKWLRKAIKKPGKLVEFESDVIPPAMMKDISDGLPGCVDKDAVRALFASVFGETSTPAMKYSQDAWMILEGMKTEVAAIKATQEPKAQPVNVTVHNYPGKEPVVNIAAPELKADAPIVNVTVEPTPVTIQNTVEVPEQPVTVNIPEQPPAQVTVENTVNVPEQPAPSVTVTPELKADVTVKMPKREKRAAKVVRNKATGEITGIEET